MEIRFAIPADVPGIIDLLRQVGQVHHEGRPDIFRAGAQKYSPSQVLAMLDNPQNPIFIAAEDGKVLGYCFCQMKTYDKDPVIADHTTCYIDDLCVDENRRGQHIGTILYNHALAYATEIGCTFLTLNVWCGNDGAQKFYENAGMTPRSITMEKKLC